MKQCHISLDFDTSHVYKKPVLFFFFFCQRILRDLVCNDPEVKVGQHTGNGNAEVVHHAELTTYPNV